jgi:RHS repeat-associated protein
VTRQDPSGHLTLYGYESRGRLASVTEKSVSDGLGGFVDHLTQYGYDDAGNLTSVTDPQGLLTTYKYDDLGRLLEVLSPDSGTTRYGYDLAGRLTSKTQAVGTPDAQTTVYAYDALGRLLGVAYSSEGRDVDYFYDGVGEGAGTTIVCNGYSVPLPQSYAGGRLSAVSLILDSATNEKVVTTYEYDARGLVLFERKYVGSATAHVTSYTYDADGNIESIAYPRGLAVDYIYGGLLQDRVSAITADAGGGAFDIATSISYRPFGDVEALSYGNGRSLVLGADLAYRLASIDVPGVLYRGYGRDSRGNITSVGFSATTTDKTFSYDEVSRLTAAGGPFGSYTYRFDKNGNRLEVNEGSATTYQYYAGTNRISGFNGDGASLSYSALGNLIQNGSNLLAYGPDDRLKDFGPSGSPAARFLHLSDGRRLQKLPTAADPVVYHHDLAGNLLAETYVTDPAGSGNPTVEYVYLGSHRLAAVTSQGLSGGYLPAIAQGPAGGSGPWYALLPLPREALRGLMWVLFGVSGISMYGALRRRRPHLAATAGGAALASVGAAAWLQLVPQAMAIPVPANAFFFINGHLGEPLALMNNAGSVVWLTEYQPYGQLYGESGSVTIGDPNSTGIAWKPAFRFPGQYEDPETALLENWWRYYQPGLGNYTRPDPLGIMPDRGVYDAYSYARQNPGNYIDPFGLTILEFRHLNRGARRAEGR